MQNRKNYQGFSLIEILVVMIILSIAVSFTILAFGDFGERRRLIVVSEQFRQHLKLAQQIAVLESRTIGIKCSAHAYQIVRYTSQNSWQPVAGHSIFKPRSLPKNISINPATIIEINPAGEASKFRIMLQSPKQQEYITDEIY